MCLILFAWQQHPEYSLVIAANRDEYHARPSAAAHFWSDQPHILGGRDLQQGGTWLGVTRWGRFAAVTNYRDPNHVVTPAISRGWLVQEFLLGTESPSEYLCEVESCAERYNGFGLIVGDHTQLCYYSNRSIGIRDLEPGLYGLSNHLLDTPWPKVARGKSALAQMLQSGDSIDAEAVLDTLSDTTIAEDDLLPDTGIGVEHERMLSPIFVRSDVYGTRSSTVLSIQHSGAVNLVERSFDNSGRMIGTISHRFQIERA